MKKLLIILIVLTTLLTGCTTVSTKIELEAVITEASATETTSSSKDPEASVEASGVEEATDAVPSAEVPAESSATSDSTTEPSAQNEATSEPSATTGAFTEPSTTAELVEPPFDHDLYVVGTVFDWEPTEAGKLLAETNSKEINLIINITEDHYAEWALDEEGEPCAVVKILDATTDTWYGIDEEDFSATTWALTPEESGHLFLKAGQYNVIYNPTEDSAVVTVL